ncbi:hypothetical protein ACFV2N_32290 [Streptomyces sp. NPDC059680]|uniref:hypothetical protein n=1 Tax=Streptomyces sp. NPDC059680 TaxID=3346904 RepID=UPI00368C64CE
MSAAPPTPSACVSLNRPSWSSRALAYLLGHQQPDGGFTCRPEQVAPRPIPYAHPSHAAVFALTALGDLHHRPTQQERQR